MGKSPGFSSLSNNCINEGMDKRGNEGHKLGSLVRDLDLNHSSTVTSAGDPLLVLVSVFVKCRK